MAITRTAQLSYYGKPTKCTHCGKNCEKKRTQMEKHAVCLKCQKEVSRRYRQLKSNIL